MKTMFQEIMKTVSCHLSWRSLVLAIFGVRVIYDINRNFSLFFRDQRIFGVVDERSSATTDNPLSIAWLMSFPVSAYITYQKLANILLNGTITHVVTHIIYE